MAIQEQRGAPLDRRAPQKSPEKGVGKADIPVQVERQGRIVPPPSIPGSLQDMSGNPLKDGGPDGAPQKEEEPVPPQLRQHHRQHDAGEAVDGAEGAVQQAPVDKVPASGRGRRRLHHPSQKSIAEKQPYHRIKHHLPVLSALPPTQSRRPSIVAQFLPLIHFFLDFPVSLCYKGSSTNLGKEVNVWTSTVTRLLP